MYKEGTNGNELDLFNLERMYTVAMNLRTALWTVLYKKTLSMSAAARKERTVGEAINLMSVDVQRFMDMMPYLNMIWSSPLQIGLAVYFIYQEMEEATFAGLSIFVLAVPVNAFLGVFLHKFTIHFMKKKDERTKLMNEILSGARVLKLYGWEKSFIRQVSAIRDEELKTLKKSAILGAGFTFMWTSIPFLVTLTFFVTWTFMKVRMGQQHREWLQDEIVNASVCKFQLRGERNKYYLGFGW